MKVGVVGCGQIGRRRAEVVHSSPTDELVGVADTDNGRSQALAADLTCRPAADWRELTDDPDIEAVIVATTHDALTPIAAAAVRQNKHVLVEKPMGRSAEEARRLLAAVNSDHVIKVGFNHRHHPALSRARSLVDQGEIGRLMYIRCRYGHGGRPGYDQEWRTDRALAGGGELLDQGIHAIDLGRWFLGEFTEASGFVSTCVWGAGGVPSENAVEDNAFALFRTAAGQTMSLHASWTQWKNLFSFEVFGDVGHLLVEGLGGSYGTEKLTIGRRNLKGGAPAEEVETFDGPDRSWELEWIEFTAAIREGRQPLGNGHDGLAALRAVEGVYESSKSGAVVGIASSGDGR